MNKEDVAARLNMFGYTVTEADSLLFDFIIAKIESRIKNECNIQEIPEGLSQIAVDMAAGEFLFSKKNAGQLTDFDFSAVEKSIEEGDTKVEYAIGEGSNTPEARFDVLLKYLMTYGLGQFVTYRRMKW